MFSHHAFAKCQPVGRIWATGRMGSIRLLYSTAAFNRTRKARCDANTKLSLSLMPIQLQGEHNMNAASCGAFKIKVDLHLQYSTAMLGTRSAGSWLNDQDSKMAFGCYVHSDGKCTARHRFCDRSLLNRHRMHVELQHKYSTNKY